MKDDGAGAAGMSRQHFDDEVFRELNACFIMVVITLRSLEDTHYIIAASEGKSPLIHLNREKHFPHYKPHQLVCQLVSQSIKRLKRKLMLFIYYKSFIINAACLLMHLDEKTLCPHYDSINESITSLIIEQAFKSELVCF